MIEQLLVRGAFIAKVEAEDLPPARHDELIDGLEQIERVGALDLLAGGGPDLVRLYGIRLKKLLSFLAAGSARAVVSPLERVGHGLAGFGGKYLRL